MDEANSNIPQGYRNVAMEQLPQRIDYEAFADGREVTLIENKRINGGGARPGQYDVHIIANERGVRRMLFGCKQLTNPLKLAGAGALVWLCYRGKTTQGRKGEEHTWVVAVKEGFNAARQGDAPADNF